MRRVKFRKQRNTPLCEYTGNHRTDAVSMQLFVYNDESYEEYKNVHLQKIISEINDSRQSNDVIWLNVHGLHDAELIRSIGGIFNLEEYVICDILNTQRRTRVEELDDVLFFSIKSLLEEDADDSLQVEQVSLLLKNNVLISFQEKKSDYFTLIRKKIRERTGSVRRRKNDYLLYMLLDSVMDNFYITIDNYEDKIEQLLTDAKLNSSALVLQRIEKHRENLNFLRRSIVPLREALYTLKEPKQEDSEVIGKRTHQYFGRLYQKSLELLEQIEYDSNALESASNIYFSSQSQKMNQIMKTLTIFSGIFMPLTFIAGVYGMNFDYMPELRSPNGYYFTLLAMLLIALALIYYFKKKKWF